MSAGAPRYWTCERIIAALQAWAATHGRTPRKIADWGSAAPDHPASPTVDLRFGSWNAAVTAAGLEPNRAGSGTYWTPDRVADAMLDWLLEYGRWPTMGDWVCGSTRHPSATTAERVGGSWAAMKRYAGWTGRCRFCDTPLRGKQRLWCSDRHRRVFEKHGRPVADLETSGCAGCGCDLDTYSRGCRPCSTRRAKRRERAKFAPVGRMTGSIETLADASPLDRSIPLTSHEGEEARRAA